MPHKTSSRSQSGKHKKIGMKKKKKSKSKKKVGYMRSGY